MVSANLRLNFGLKILKGKFQKQTMHMFYVACHSGVACWSPELSYPILSGMWISPLSHFSMLYCSSPISPSVAIMVIRSTVTHTVSKELIFYLTMAPRHKSSDVGIPDISKRSPKVLPLSEKVKLLNLIRGKKWYADVANIYSIKNLLSMSSWRRKGNMC